MRKRRTKHTTRLGGKVYTRRAYDMKELMHKGVAFAEETGLFQFTGKIDVSMNLILSGTVLQTGWFYLYNSSDYYRVRDLGDRSKIAASRHTNCGGIQWGWRKDETT